MGPTGFGTAVARVLGRFARRADGVSVIEFAIVAPIFLVIIAGTIDFGGVLYTKFTLDSGLSAASNYVLVNSAKVTTADGAGLMTQAVQVLDGGSNAGVTSKAQINKSGPKREVTNGNLVTGGTPADADKCYCPRTVNSVIEWGNPMATCQTQCADTTTAGTFVTLSVSRNYSPMFPLGGYGVVRSGAISAHAIVQVK